MRPLLLDTGPLVALLDRRDRNHSVCVEAFGGLAEELVTTEAVITEACYLLQRRTARGVLAVQFVLEAGVTVAPLSGMSLMRVEGLMAQYADAPMDYADASLVAVAETLQTDQIFTLDRRHFLMYRLYDSESFVLVP